MAEENKETPAQPTASLGSRFWGKLKSFFGIGGLSVVQGEHQLSDEEAEKVFTSKEWEETAATFVSELPQQAKQQDSEQQENSINLTGEQQDAPQTNQNEAEMTQEQLDAYLANFEAKHNAKTAELEATIKALQTQNEALTKQKGADKEEVLKKAAEVKPFTPARADAGNSHLNAQENDAPKVVKINGAELDLSAIEQFGRQNADVFNQSVVAYQSQILPFVSTDRKTKPTVKAQRL